MGMPAGYTFGASGYVYASDGSSGPWMLTPSGNLRKIGSDNPLPISSNNATATSTAASIAVGSATEVLLQPTSIGLAIAIKFGDDSVTAVATDMLVAQSDGPKLVAIPTGSTTMSFIRVGASDCAFNYTLCA